MTRLQSMKCGLIACVVAVASAFVVVAQLSGSNALDTGLEAGDIIRAVDRTALQTTSQFETLVHKLRPGDVLQVERKGKLQYLAFEME